MKRGAVVDMKTYTVLGAGRQGKAAAYDLARFGNAKAILLADENTMAAKETAAQLNLLLRKNVVQPIGLNARSTDAVYNLLMESAGFVSAVHYDLNLALTELAIETGCHMVDLGGNTDIVRKQHELNGKAKKGGIRIIPDCGMAPGFNLNLVRAALNRVENPYNAQIYCGGIPQTPKTALGYHFPFSISGLVNECSGEADIICGGKVAKWPVLSTMEIIMIPEVGMLEATHTSGGLSTAPWTLLKKFPTLRTLEYKTLRYPGHWKVLQDFAARGELASGLEALASVTPRDNEDVGIISASCSGTTTEGENEYAILEVIDRYDPITQLTAMQRLTGFHASIMLIAATRTLKECGVLSVESIDPQMVISEFAKRDIVVDETHARQKSNR